MPSKTEGGNTIIPLGLSAPNGKKHAKGANQQLSRWVLTIKMKADRTGADLADHFKGFCKEYYYQLEQGEAVNAQGQKYLHWQCAVLTLKPYSFSQLKNLTFNDAHIEPCKDWFAAKTYCAKAETRKEGPYSHKEPPLNPKYQLKLANFYPWQHKVLSWLQADPDDRKIKWIYDLKGGSGKTKFVLFMVDNHKAVRYNSGKESDIAYSYNKEKIVLFDFQRAKAHINYSTMEDLKNGHLFSGKYESTAKRFDPPHVVVFANTLPDFSSLSLDRWEVYQLDDKTMTREYDFTIDEKSYALSR